MGYLATMKTLNKSDLEDRVLRLVRVKREHVVSVLQTFLDVLREELVHGRAIRLSGICKIYPISSTPRRYHNIHSHKIHMAEPRRRLRVKFSPSLLDQLNSTQ